MPISPPKKCNFPNCRENAIDKGYCKQHFTQVNQRYNKTRDKAVQKQYNTRVWANIRKQTLTRRPMCECSECQGMREVADTVHHIDHDPFNNNTDNLMSMARSCHSRYHAGNK